MMHIADERDRSCRYEKCYFCDFYKVAIDLEDIKNLSCTVLLCLHSMAVQAMGYESLQRRIMERANRIDGY